MFIHYLIFIFFFYSYISCDEIKVIKTNLPENEKKHAFASALIAMENSNSTGQINIDVIKQMDTKFGPKWNCLTFPTGSGGAIDITDSAMIHFSYENYEFILFKMKQEITKVNANRFLDIIEEAKKSTLNITYDVFKDDTEKAKFIKSIHESLDLDFTDCGSFTDTFTDGESYGSCYRKIAWHIWVGKLAYTHVTVGDMDSHYSRVNRGKKFLQAKIGKLHFTVINIE